MEDFYRRFQEKYLRVRCGDCQLSLGGARCSPKTPCFLGLLHVWYCAECAADGTLTIDHAKAGHPYSRIKWEAMPRGQKRQIIKRVLEREGSRPNPPIRLAYGGFIERMQGVDAGYRYPNLPALEGNLSVKCRCGHNPQTGQERLLQQVTRTEGSTLYLRS